LPLPWLELYAMVIESVEKRSITKNKGIEACILVNHSYNNKKIQGDKSWHDTNGKLILNFFLFFYFNKTKA
jgi:hypothetical protein